MGRRAAGMRQGFYLGKEVAKPTKAAKSAAVKASKTADAKTAALKSK
jgi:hypothetical protein